VLRKILGPKKDKVAGAGGDYIMRSVMMLLLTQYYLGD
jgi:hypothetical protein